MTLPLRILVCGSRDWTDYDFLAEVLDSLAVQEGAPYVERIAHGAARGADRLAGFWAAKRNIEVSEYPADWNRMGRSAGFLRNSLMLREFEPTTVVAFKDDFNHQLRRGGTEHMVKIARKADVTTMVFSHHSTSIVRPR